MSDTMKKDSTKRTNWIDGYESIIYLEERTSKQLYVLRTWYEGCNYEQALLSQADIVASFHNNEELVVTNGRLNAVVTSEQKKIKESVANELNKK